MATDYPTAADATLLKQNADTINEVVASSNLKTSIASDGKTKDTLVGINAKFNGIPKGNYADGTELTNVEDVAYYGTNKAHYAAANPSDLPITIDATTYPNPENHVPALAVKSGITGNNLDGHTTSITGLVVHPLNIFASAQVGDTVAAGTTALRDAVNDKIYVTKDASGNDITVSGEITALDFPSGTATVGADTVNLQEYVAAIHSRYMSISDLQSVSGQIDGQSIYLSLGGRSGWFEWDSSDLSGKVSIDPIQGVWIAPSSDTTGSSGAWVRQDNDKVNIKWFGAVDSLVVDNTAAIQAAINVVKNSDTKVRTGLDLTHPIFEKSASLHIPDGFYRHDSSLWFGVDVDAEDSQPTPDYTKVVNKITGTGVLIAKCTGKVAWDFVGVFGLSVADFVTFWGDYTNTPRVGMLFARSGTGGAPNNPSAGTHRVTNARVIGSFDLCCVYNYASEVNHWTNVDWLNFTGKAAYINTANNVRYAVVSEYATLSNTVQSSYADCFVNPNINCARTDAAVGDEGVMILESVSYGPKVIGGYMDTSTSIYMPYFRFVGAQGLVGTQAITQSPSITDVVFEQESSPIVQIENKVTELNIKGCSMPSNVDHIVVTSTGDLSEYDIQPFSGDAINNPVTFDNQGGSLQKGRLRTIPVADVFLNNYQWEIGSLTQDGNYYDLDIASNAGVPSNAKYVHVKTRVRSAAISDATTLTLRGDSTTSVAESMISLPNGLAASQYFEGIVPVVDGKIQYAASAGLTVASIIIKAYEV